MKYLALASTALVLLFAHTPAVGGAPGLLESVFTYQGQLKLEGSPYTGSQDMTFTLWDSEVSGTQTGDTLIIPVDIEDGLFQVDLGFGPTDWENAGYLQIELDGQVMSPRQRLRPAPFALFAAYALESGGAGATSPWQLNGDDVYYNAGRVGIGTDEPSQSLSVAGGITAASLTAENSTGVGGIGVRGHVTGLTGLSVGVSGISESTSGRAVYGRAQSETGNTYGVYGRSSSSSGRGVYGYARSSSGTTFGVAGEVVSPDGYAAHFTGPAGSRNYFQQRLGIGTDNPTAQLHIESPATASPFRITVDGSTRMRLAANGGLTVGSGLSPPANGLRVTGQASMIDEVRLITLGTAGSTSLCRNASDVISTCSSSARYKHDIADLINAGKLIEPMRAVSFRWNDGDQADLGLVAEEVAAIDPRLATYDDQGRIEGVKYDRIAAVLVRAFQEQQARIQAELASRDATIEQLQAELSDVRQRTETRMTRIENLLMDTRQVARENR